MRFSSFGFSATALCWLFLTAFAVQADAIRLSEPVHQDDTSETFGSVLNTELPEVTLTKLMQGGEQATGKPFKLKVRIAKVCQKKGCFFIAQENQHVVRIAFRDYGFFIPTDSSGKTVTLAGELIEKTLTQDQAAHFSSDLDNEARIKAGKTFEIVADSVVIPRV